MSKKEYLDSEIGSDCSRNVTTAASLVGPALRRRRRHRMLHGGEMVLIVVSGRCRTRWPARRPRGADSRLDLRLAVGACIRPPAEAETAADLARAHAERLGLAYFLDRVEFGARRRGRRSRGGGAPCPPRRPERPRARSRRHPDRPAIPRRPGGTVLVRLFDGAGRATSSGIAFSRGRLIHPLLASRRADILAYLTGRGLDWAEDASNPGAAPVTCPRRSISRSKASTMSADRSGARPSCGSSAHRSTCPAMAR